MTAGEVAGDMPSGGSGVMGDPFEGRPSLMRIGDKVAVVGVALNIQLQASDPQNDLLSFSLRSALPEGAKFEKEVGLFSWTPVPDQVGRSVLLTFEVSDGMLKDQETIAVRVSAAGSMEDFPPAIDPISDQLLTVNQPWSYQLVGEDPNGQQLVYRIDGAIPLGLSFDATTGVAQWTPSVADVGSYDLVAAVSDGQDEATTPLRLIVRDENNQSSTNTPPMFNPLPPQQVNAGEMLIFEVSAMDDNPANLVYAAERLPDGAEFNPNARRFIWTPSAAEAGNSYDAVFVVNDEEFRSYLRVSIEVLRVTSACPADPAGMSGGEAPLSEGAQLSDRVICDSSEVDRYQITLNREAVLDITALFNMEDGDLDLILYNSTGGQIASATGVTGEERMLSDVLSPGTYTVEVILYGGGGPILYQIGYTLIDPADACMPDTYEGGGNNTVSTAAPIPTNQTIPLNLCSGDTDYFSFYANRGELINVTALFRHMIADIDLRLIGPNSDDEGQMWYASSVTDNETIEVISAPTTGDYIIEVRRFQSDREVAYDLSVTTTPPPPCDGDRFEPENNSLSGAEPLVPELYRDLTSCPDADWYSSVIPAGRSLILYLTFDEGEPTVSAQGQGGLALPVTPRTFNAPVDGCVTDRETCKRYQIDPSPNGERVNYEVSFDRIGVEYDIRVRVGDEVGATCVDELDCNEGFLCYEEFDVFAFSNNLCAKECNEDGDCGRDRACMLGEDGFNLCMQRCDRGLSCRSSFTCQPGILTTAGQSASLCLSEY